MHENNFAQWKAEYETYAGKKVRVEIHNGQIEITLYPLKT